MDSCCLICDYNFSNFYKGNQRFGGLILGQIKLEAKVYNQNLKECRIFPGKILLALPCKGKRSHTPNFTQLAKPRDLFMPESPPPPKNYYYHYHKQKFIYKNGQLLINRQKKS
jgi:hypothetical protein